jgi:hypothetical protein
MIDVECEAGWLLRGIDGVPSARAFAKHHGLPVRTVPRGALPAPGGCWMHLGEWTVFVRSGLSRIELRWTIIHEAVESHVMRVLRYQGPDVERVVEAITAAIVAPRDAFRRKVRSCGRDLSALATSFDTTQTAMALRLAEAHCVEATAVVRPGLVRVRVAESFVMPNERELRRAAAAGREGLERHVLTDDRRRVALVAA